jgi:hypothetical protein
MMLIRRMIVFRTACHVPLNHCYEPGKRKIQSLEAPIRHMEEPVAVTGHFFKQFCPK